MSGLKGKTILITRAAEDAEAWTRAIEERGGQTVHLPCITCETIRDPDTARSLRTALDGADWLVLTSRRGAIAVAELLERPGLETLKVAAVGEATAGEATSRLGRCDLVAHGGTGGALARELAVALEAGGGAGGTRVVVTSANRARRDLEEILEPRGVSVTRIVVYRTIAAPERKPKHDLKEFGLDGILLASPTAVRGLVNVARVPRDLPVYTIGPTTTAAARSLGLEITAEAERPAIESLLEAL